MKCPSCQHDNPDRAKFCAECGHAFAPSCPACGHLNKVGARFCNECGHKLGAAERPAASDPPAAERRQLTVMFCDLVSATELSARLDPEDLRDVIREFQGAARAAVHEYEGHIAQHLGDGLLIYFGYPTAHEDDPVRAAHAGLGVINRVAQLNTRLVREHGVELQVRVGIHTGQTVVGAVGEGPSGEQLAIGEAPNLAARLQGIAEPGTVVISLDTAKLIRRSFVCDELGTIKLKGFAEPRPIFRVVRPVRGHLDAREDRSPFVGRDAEASALVSLWKEARGGTGRSVLIRGDAGVGKSRLVSVVSDAVAAGGDRELTARCSSYLTSSAMRPIMELIAQLAGLVDDDGPAARHARLERLVAEHRAGGAAEVQLLAAFLGLPGDPPPLSPQVKKARTSALLIDLLVAAARKRALALIVDDLHWIDHSSIEFLGALVERAAEAPMLIVLTSRTQFQAPLHVDTEIHLNRLPRAAVEQIVASVIGARALPPEFVAQIVLKADGNPLFVEELTRMVLESGLVPEPNDGSRSGGVPLPPLAIPATLQDSLTARLDRLSPVRKALVQLCATLGRQFSYELIFELVRSFEEDMQNELRRLTDGELLYERGVPPRSVFVFKHALIQDAAYSSLLRRTRIKYHARVAEVLRERFPDTPPEILAHHYTEAGEVDRAVAAWQQAGGAALGNFALAEALMHLQRGLAVLRQAGDGADRVEAELGLRTLLAVPLMLTQGFASREVEANNVRLLDLCGEAGDRAVAQQFPALWGAWTIQVVSGNHPRAEDAAARLTDLAERTGDSGIRLAALTSHGTAAMMRGRFDEARRAFTDALTVYDPAAHAGLATLFGQDAGAMCASFLTWIHCHDGDLARAEHHAAVAMAMCDALNQPSTRAFVETVIATYRCLRGDFDQAERHSETVMRLSVEQGMPHWDAQAQITHGWSIAGRGRADEGAAVVRRGIDGLLGIGSRASMTFYWRGLAEANLLAGDLTGARAALDEATAYMEASDERIHQAGLELLAARIALAAGRRDDARAAAARGLATAERQRAAELVNQARALRAELER